MVWSKVETINREEMASIQLSRLQETVRRIYDKVPYYRGKMEAVSLTPEAITTLDDLSRLPFTVKEDLRKNYPFGLFAVPKDDVVRVHASSGTTGKPTVVGYTQNDIDMWSELIARLVTMAGADRTDVAQIAFGYGLFTGAFGLHYGLEKSRYNGGTSF